MRFLDFTLWYVLAGGLGLYVVYYIITAISVGVARRKIIKENRCQPAVKYPSGDPIIGLRLMRENIKLIKERKFLEGSRNRFNRYGNTFSLIVTGQPGSSELLPTQD